MKEKVSVIIPVHNEEKCIKHCVNSFLGQSYSPKEILLVENASTDNSWKVLQNLEREHEEVKACRIEKAGVSEARNEGIRKAEGVYLFFADADDYADPLMLESLIKAIEKDESQLAVAGYYLEIPNESKKGTELIPLKQAGQELVLSSRFQIKQEMVQLWDSGLMYNVWNKLFLKKVVDSCSIWFPEKKGFNEDRDFVRNYVICIDKMVCIENSYYHYIRERQNSATKKYRPEMLEIRKEEYQHLKDFFERMGIYDEKGIEYVAREHLDRVIGCAESLFWNQLLDKKTIKKELRTISEDEKTREALQYAIPKSRKMKCIARVFRGGNVALIYYMMKTISIVRDKYPMLFYQLRQRR